MFGEFHCLKKYVNLIWHTKYIVPESANTNDMDTVKKLCPLRSQNEQISTSFLVQARYNLLDFMGYLDPNLE